jgi:EAL domain-containing protein (putative c-di-GMP-specific phosphodiesterase class I)
VSTLEEDLVSTLRAAFHDGSLRLYYQPEVDLRSGAVPGMEVYARWRHPLRGMLDSAAVTRAAARAGLLDELAAWTLGAAVDEAGRWHALAAGTRIRPPRLWVNVGPEQLSRPTFSADVERAVAGRLLPPGAVGLEFTEEALGLAGRGVPGLLAHLRGAGVATAVDRFGSWFGSLATLDVLPLDLVRIDHRYHAAMLRDIEGESALASIITLAHRRRIAVSAEGVDSLLTASRLAAMRCDRAAGALFCPPLPVEDARMIALGKGRPGRWRGPAGPAAPRP